MIEAIIITCVGAVLTSIFTCVYNAGNEHAEENNQVNLVITREEVDGDAQSPEKHPLNIQDNSHHKSQKVVTTTVKMQFVNKEKHDTSHVSKQQGSSEIVNAFTKEINTTTDNNEAGHLLQVINKLQIPHSHPNASLDSNRQHANTYSHHNNESVVRHRNHETEPSSTRSPTSTEYMMFTEALNAMITQNKHCDTHEDQIVERHPKSEPDTPHFTKCNILELAGSTHEFDTSCQQYI